MDTTSQIQKFKEFLEDSYHAKLLETVRKGKEFIEIDFIKISRFDHELADELLENPEELIKTIEIAVGQFDLDNKKVPQIFIKNLPDSCKVPLSEISDQLNKFLTFEGYVMRPSEIFLKCVRATYECPSCGSCINILMLGREFISPKICSCGRKGKFKLINKELVKFQRNRNNWK